MKPKWFAQKVRNILGPALCQQFKVQILDQPSLVAGRSTVRISPRGRRRELVKVSHTIYPTMAAIMPLLRTYNLNAYIDACRTDSDAPIDIKVFPR